MYHGLLALSQHSRKVLRGHVRGAPKDRLELLRRDAVRTNVVQEAGNAFLGNLVVGGLDRSDHVLGEAGGEFLGIAGGWCE